MGKLKKHESLEWKIANTNIQQGRFDQVGRYLAPLKDIGAAEIKVPEKQEKESTIGHNIGGFIVPTTRSFEIWWNSEESDMKIVLVTEKNDLALYTNAYKNMYPGSSINELKRTEPKWFNPNMPYDYFDISTINGNHVTTFEDTEAEYFITQIVNAMKLAKHGWLQIVFKEYQGFTNILRNNTENLRRYAEKRDDKTDDISLYLKKLIDYSRNKQNVVNSVMSIRGLVEFNDGLDMLKQIPCNIIQTPGIERLQLYRYNPHKFFDHHQPTFMKDGMQRYTIYPRRMLPDPTQYIPDLTGYLKPKTSFFGPPKYLPRRPLPFLIITPDEMPIFLHLPDPSRTGGVIKTVTKQLIPPSPTKKRGYNIGFFERYEWESSDEYKAMFGKQVVSKDINAVTITFPSDFTKHGFVVGGTGSGKSSMMRALFKHFEMSNVYSSFPQNVPVKEIIDKGMSNEMETLKYTDYEKTLEEQHIGEESAIIYIDPKGNDSELFIKQTEKINRDKHLIHYLDPEITPFSINPLELPSNIIGDNRELLVAKYIGLLADVLDKMFGGSKQFVFLNRVIKLVITYLYSYSDSPTFLDMYKVVHELATNDTNPVEVLTGIYGKPDAELEKSLNQLRDKKSDAYESFFNRLEQIKITKIFREMFCREKSTVRVDDIIQPGHYTVFRLSKTNIPEDLVNLVMETIIAQIWFAVRQRAAKYATDPTTNICQIILVVDEFWMLEEFALIKEILAQGRSMGLGMLLATQSITQVNSSDLGEILANTNIKLIGRVTGGESKQLATMIDPDDPGLVTQLVNHADHQWTAKIPPPLGEDRLRPMEFTNHFDTMANDVVELQMDNMEYRRFLEYERKRYKPLSDDEQADSSKKEHDDKNAWMRQMSKPLPTHIYWDVLLFLDKRSNAPATLQEISNHLALQAHWKQGKSDRNYVKKTLLKEMVENKYIHYVNTRTGDIYDLNIYNDIDRKLPPNTSFCMTVETAKKYFEYSEEKVGKDGTADIPEGIKQLTSFYKKKGLFITTAIQNVKKGELRTDFVAYDYNTHTAISVELESLGEASSNQQQVIKNLMKWKGLGFQQCHIWSFDANIKNLVEKVQEHPTDLLTDEDKKKIYPFVMKHEDYTLSKLRKNSKKR